MHKTGVYFSVDCNCYRNRVKIRCRCWISYDP